MSDPFNVSDISRSAQVVGTAAIAGTLSTTPFHPLAVFRCRVASQPKKPTGKLIEAVEVLRRRNGWGQSWFGGSSAAAIKRTGNLLVVNEACKQFMESTQGYNMPSPVRIILNAAGAGVAETVSTGAIEAIAETPRAVGNNLLLHQRLLNAFKSVPSQTARNTAFWSPYAHGCQRPDASSLEEVLVYGGSSVVGAALDIGYIRTNSGKPCSVSAVVAGTPRVAACRAVASYAATKALQAVDKVTSGEITQPQDQDGSIVEALLKKEVSRGAEEAWQGHAASI